MTNNTLAKFAGVLLASVAAAALAPAYAADAVLSGAITSPSGEKLGGVTVSAKLDGSTITTSVYTDETGNYYFPPLATGKYSVWAQALSFQTAKGNVELTAAKQQNLVLQPLTDSEARWRQLPDSARTIASGSSRLSRPAVRLGWPSRPEKRKFTGGHQLSNQGMPLAPLHLLRREFFHEIQRRLFAVAPL